MQKKENIKRSMKTEILKPDEMWYQFKKISGYRFRAIEKERFQSIFKIAKVNTMHFENSTEKVANVDSKKRTCLSAKHTTSLLSKWIYCYAIT